MGGSLALALASGPRAWPPEDWKLGNIYASKCIDIRKNEKNLGVISWKCVYLCNQLKIKDEVIGSYPEKPKEARALAPGPRSPESMEAGSLAPGSWPPDLGPRSPGSRADPGHRSPESMEAPDLVHRPSGS